MGVLTFVIEAVYPVDRGTLVVATEDVEVIGVLNLVGQEKADGLQAVLPSVHVVSQKEVVGLRRVAPVLEEPQQVIVLAMEVTTDLDRGLHLNQDGL